MSILLKPHKKDDNVASLQETFRTKTRDCCGTMRGARVLYRARASGTCTLGLTKGQKRFNNKFHLQLKESARLKHFILDLF